MTKYFVTFTIGVICDTPQEAAWRAYEQVRDTPPTLYVHSEDGDSHQFTMPDIINHMQEIENRRTPDTT